MINKKHALRIGTILCILVFLLIPLMSSHVAASFMQPLGSVWTINWPPPPGAGPTAGGAIAGPPSPVGDSSPFDICFQVDYNYTDAYPAGMGGIGSNHWMSVTGSYQPGGTGPWTRFTFNQNVTFVRPNSFRSGTYTTPWIIGYGGSGTNFNLNVVVNCQDISTMTTFTWTSTAVTFTI